QHELAVDPGNADGADRSLEGDRGNRESGGGADHRENVGIILAVGGKDDYLDEDFVEVAEGEEGADRPVDHAGGKGFLGGWPACPVDEVAGELARGGGLCAVIDGEGEEVGSGAGVRGDDGGEDDGFAEGDGDGAVGLLGEEPGFDLEFFSADVSCDVDD